jgi:putative ABC transport system permease protein
MRLDELRYAARTLRASPGFSLVVVAMLGLGIGTAAAMFSILDTVLVRPLPYEHPERLVALWNTVPKDGLGKFRVSPFDYAQWREGAADLFERLALTGSASATLTGGQEATVLTGTRVSEDYFPALGVLPAAGRLFTGDDFRPSAEAVVVLSQALWVGRFGADPAILGRSIALDEQMYVVIGVLPRLLLPLEARASGSVPFTRDEEQFWIPLKLVQPSARAHVFGVIGRLRPGVTTAQAKAFLATLDRRLEATFPEIDAGRQAVLVPLVDEALGSVRSSLWILMGAVGGLLLIACVNVAHLLLLRAASREREVAIRIALGTSRGGIARLFLAEDVILIAAGGLVAVPTAVATIRSVIKWNPIAVPRLAETSLDTRALAFGILVCLAASLLVSMAPLLRWTARDLAGELRAGSKGTAGLATRRWRLWLARSEMALAVVLVVGAGLLVKSFVNLQNVDPGFTAGRVLIFDLEHPKTRYPERGDLVSFYDRLLVRLAGLPGVTRVAASYDPPLASNWYQAFDLPDIPVVPGAQDRGGLFRTVTPGYFEALGVKVLEGRAFTEADDVGAAGAVIVNEALARRFLPGPSPLGQRFEATTTQWRWGEAVPRTFRVVGVVKNEVFGDVGRPPEPAFYLPFRQTPQERMSVLLRTRGEPSRLLPELRRQLRELDPQLGLAHVTTLSAPGTRRRPGAGPAPGQPAL